jgi:hypothetical protein
MKDYAGTGLTPGKPSSGRKGILIPIILGVLTVFLILIFVIIRTSSETYTGVALINHHLHARMIAFAVMEEAAVMIRQGIAHEAISGRKSAQWHRNDLLAAIFSNKGEYTIDVKEDLKTIDYLYGTVSKDPYGVNDPGGFSGGERVLPQKKEANLPEILAATIRFHNFKNIQFSHANIYNNPAAYYINPLGYGSGPPRGDYFGFYTVNVKIKFGVVEQSLQLTRDVKIVNNEPIGRAYVFFSTDTPDVQKQSSDLNSPGKLYINAANDGRIFIQGPYMIDVEGSPDGTSNPEPSGLGYPAPANDGTWEGFGFLPTPRAITTCSTMSSSIERPKSISGFGMTMGIGADCFAFNLGSDPALKAMPEAQNYWAASADVGTQNFSIAGLPNEFRGWQGLLYRKNAASNSQVAPFLGDFNAINIDMEARPEGMLIGRYNMINFLKFHSCTSVSAVLDVVSGLFSGMGGGADTTGGSSTPSTPPVSSLDNP